MGQKVSTLGDVFSWKNGGGDSSAKNGGDSSAKNGDAPVVQCDCCATAVGPASTADAAQAPEQSAENIYDADPQPSSSSRPPDVVCAEHAKCCDNAASSSSANKNSAQSSSKSASGSKKHWVLRFNCSRPKSKNAAKCCAAPAPETVPETDRVECDACVCTRYQRTEDQQPSGAAAAAAAAPSFELNEPLKLLPIVRFVRPDFDDDDDDDYDDRHRHDMDGRDDDDDLSSMPLEFDGTFDAFAAFNHRHSDLVLPSFDDAFPMDLNSDMSADEYINEDFEDRAYRERAKEIQEGIDPPPGFRPGVIELLELGWPKRTLDNLTTLFNYRATLSAMSPPNGMDDSHRIHTSIDYIHYLVPDLLQITNCSFYWGKMDRYEAEKLLENRPEGTFLLRDSAQEEYLFSVSFRKYGRSLHARIEQWNHLFSFDSRDPGVFASSTVCGLIEHYKDPSCCMFFEPMLTIPFPRNFTFSLMHTCRATICSQITYDDVNQLALPKTLKSYLKEYHYKQRVRIRQFDCEN